MNRIKNLNTIIAQSQADKLRINAKKQSDKNKVVNALSDNTPTITKHIAIPNIVGGNGKVSKVLAKRNNAQEDQRELTQKRNEIIKGSKADNTTEENSWRLSIAKVRQENPELAYKDILKLASTQYRKNIGFK